MAKKKIKLIVPHFFPEINALTSRLDPFIRKLREKYDVEIIFLLQSGASYDEERTLKEFPYDNVSFRPVVSEVYNRKGFVLRSIGETINNYRLWMSARKVQADALFVSIPQLMLLPVSGLFLIFDRTPKKTLEIRDLTWEYLDISGIFGWFVKKFFEFAAVFSINRFDEVLCCTEGQAQFVNERTNRSASVVRNGISAAKFKELKSLEDGTNSDYLTVSYFGTFGHAQNLMIFVKAAKLLSGNDKVRFKLIGGGPDFDKIYEYVKFNNLTNVELLEKVSWEELLRHYSETDVCYAQLKPGPGFEKAEPSKLFEYFSTGKYVVYGGTGLAEKLAKSFDNVEVVYPDNEELLAKVIGKLVSKKLARSESNINKIESEFVRENIFSDYINMRALNEKS